MKNTCRQCSNRCIVYVTSITNWVKLLKCMIKKFNGRLRIQNYETKSNHIIVLWPLAPTLRFHGDSYASAADATRCNNQKVRCIPISDSVFDMVTYNVRVALLKRGSCRPWQRGCSSPKHYHRPGRVPLLNEIFLSGPLPVLLPSLSCWTGPRGAAAAAAPWWWSGTFCSDRTFFLISAGAGLPSRAGS